MFSCLQVSAGSRKFIQFQQLEALSTSTVSSAYQDGVGGVWLNTNYGLYRYNGVSLQHMKEPLLMKAITGNKEYFVYATAYEAIYRWDIRDYSVRKIVHDDINFLNCALCPEGNTLWIASRNNIYQYANDSVSLYLSLPQEDITISTLLLTSSGNLLAGTTKHGLYQINKERLVLEIMPHTGNISTLFSDSKNNLWIGTTDKGVFRINPDMNEVTRFSTEKTRHGQLTNNFIRAICEDQQKNIWIGTLSGINILEGDTLKAEMHGGIGNESSIWCLMPDNQGGIWVGTFYDGAYYSNPENDPFVSVSLSKERDMRLINAMVEDSHGDIWVFTDKFGMFRAEKNNNSMMHYIAGSDRYKFKSAYYDSKRDIIWIGTHMDGLIHYNIQQNKWVNYPFVNADGNPVSEIINDIKPWRGKLYLGTSHGVFEFNPENNNTSSIRKLPDYEGMVYSLAFDHKERLWIGGVGLFIHDVASGKTYSYTDSIKKPFNNSRLNFFKLFKDSKNRMWAASLGRGFFLLEEEEPIIYTHKNIGLANNFTSLIGEVEEDILLVGTNSGLSIFDIRNNRCYNYNKDNGLGITSARSGAILRKANGEVLIGGVDGIESISPWNLTFTQDSIDIEFDKLIINNRQIVPLAGDSILKQALPFVDKVVLNHDQANVTIEMASFDFSKPYPIFYEYRLGDGETEWTPFQISQPITLINLAPGEYKLYVRSTLNKSSGKYKTIGLAIKVKAPWYATTLAKILYICMALFLGLWLLYFVYSKMLVKQMLTQKEKENLDRMRFFIKISHEIRTPLTLIIGQLELFLKRNNPKGVGNENVLSIYNNARRMQQIVSNLLDFEKHAQGYTQITVSEVDFIAFVMDIKEVFSQYAGYRDIDFVVTLPDEPLPVMIDRTSMQRVFSNLLINAFKYTPDGGKVEITVEKTKQDKIGEQLRITCKDNGKGIAEEALPHIFNPFYQDSSGISCSRHNHGTGIGLALSKGIVELHHGTIMASSSQGQGATFVITLPLGDTWFIHDSAVLVDNNPEANSINSGIELVEVSLPDSKEPTQTGNQSTKMLIVEDDEDLRAMLKSVFKHFYKVYEAGDGEEGFHIARKEQPDIVISDVVMPVMNGLNLCAKLKQDFQTSHIPVILLTAQSSTDQSVEGINAGADDYITKPFSIELLEARCTNLLNNRRLLQMKYSQSEVIYNGVTTNDKDSQFIDSVVEIIEQNLFTETLSLPLLCRELGMGKTLLNAKIKGITGYSPREFIEIIRLKKAATMLRTKEMNVSEIAYSLGFSSPKYFTIRFKKLFGKTPTMYVQADIE